MRIFWTGFIFIAVLPLSAQTVGSSLSGPRALLTAKYAASPSSVPAPPWVPPAERTATFEVNYTGFSPEAQTAFQYAVDIWSGLIESDVPIVVSAVWEDLPGNVLGSAGASGLWYNFPGASTGGVLYPSPLADKLSGSNLAPGEADIVANFDSGTNWYFGLDGAPSFSQFDLVSVVLHEIGHGLGFSGTAQVGEDSNGYFLNSPLLGIYDNFVVDGDGNLLMMMDSGSAMLGAALVSENLFWNGPNAGAFSGPFPPKLHAPLFWEPGSSFAHFDEDLYLAGSDASLMTPQIGNGESIHTPGAMCLGLLEDIGWTVDYAALGSGTPGCTDPAACNFDSEATLSDGSCFYPVAGEPCGDCASVWNMSVNLAAQEGVEFTFGGVGSVQTVDVSVQWPGAANDEWVSDLLVVICDPNGGCFEWGGFDQTAGLPDAGVTWPGSWDNGSGGSYSATLDLSGLGLSGLGTWSVFLYNGYGSSSGLNLPDVTFTVPFVCPLADLTPGCVDSVACNFDSAAEYDDGSCEYLSCINCTSTQLMETFQGYGTSEPLTVQSDAGWETWSGTPGSTEDPYVVMDGADASAYMVSSDVDPSQANDLYFPIGATTGTHMVQFSLEAQMGYTAYYNFQGAIQPGVDWALEAYIFTDGTIGFYWDGDSTAVTGFQFGQDNFLTHLFDLDNDELRILLGGQLIALLPFDEDLGGVNFYPVSFAGGLGAFLLDDVTVCTSTALPVGCMDEAACNYDPAAVEDDGSCWTPSDYGWCDCQGNTEDALGNCGGNCEEDLDGDGLCDDVDPCIGGVPDDCGVCDGPGAVFECGCNDIPTGDCDCFGNQLDAVGVCGGDCAADVDGDGVCDAPGCTDPEACNFEATANIDDGSCTYAEPYYDCAGACLNDLDGDGVCDELELEGCTDEAACNFNPEATEEDGACAYLLMEEIDGDDTVSEGDTQLYVAMPSAPDNSYTWAVTGGEIQDGQGTAIVTVEWTTPGSQGIQAVETNPACNGGVVGLDVEVQPMTGVGQFAPPSNWTPSPNPARASFRLGNGADLVRVLIPNGAEVRRWSGITPDQTLVLGNLAPGLYLVERVSAGLREVKPLVVLP